MWWVKNNQYDNFFAQYSVHFFIRTGLTTMFFATTVDVQKKNKQVAMLKTMPT